MKLKDLLFVLQAETNVQVVTENGHNFLNVFRTRGFNSDPGTLKKFRSFCRRFNYMAIYNHEIKKVQILDGAMIIVLENDDATCERFGNYTPR